jgi:hypothetical protein
MENKNLKKLVNLIESHPDFVDHLSKIEAEYAVKIYKISELSVPSILDLYNVMEKKYLRRYTGSIRTEKPIMKIHGSRINSGSLFGYCLPISLHLAKILKNLYYIFYYRKMMIGISLGQFLTSKE